MRKILNTAVVILFIAFIVIQFFQPKRNTSGNLEQSISKIYPVPEGVQHILNVACNDCHSNKTNYPWYANIQPVAWWLADHVEEGKRELNFNEFATYRIYRQYHKLEKLTEELEEDEMPLSSYTIIHRNADLNDEQKTELILWANGLRNLIQSQYPPDSLVRPKKKK